MPRRLQTVIDALEPLRIGHLIDEYTLHRNIAAALDTAGIVYDREVPLGQRSRADFLTEGGILIEAKKGRPVTAAVVGQLYRYAEYPIVKGLILVVEGHCDVPGEIRGKPVAAVRLRRQWGIAL